MINIKKEDLVTSTNGKDSYAIKKSKFDTKLVAPSILKSHWRYASEPLENDFTIVAKVFGDEAQQISRLEKVKRKTRNKGCRPAIMAPNRQKFLKYNALSPIQNSCSS